MPAERLRVAWTRHECLWLPLTVFALARVVSGIVLAVGSRAQVALDSASGVMVTHPEPASPGYWGVISNWDGQWYRLIVEEGYPSTLPTLDGEVLQSQYGFLPVYPTLVRLVMALTRLEFPQAASLVSMTCAAVATVLVYRLLLTRGDRFFAAAGVVVLNTFPAAPILQTAYTEGLVLLLIAIALTLLGSRRYVLLVPLVLVLALTRPLTLPLAAVMGLHFLRRLGSSQEDPFPRRDRVGLVLLGLGTIALTGLWPVVATLATGDPTAYLSTMAAWAQDGEDIGLAGSWLVSAVRRPITLVVLLPVALVIGRRVLGRPVLPPELRDWSWLYPLYMVCATTPGSGIFRYLLLAVGPWCLLDPLAVRTARVDLAVRWVALAALVALGVAGQYFWVREVFIVTTPTDQPFP